MSDDDNSGRTEGTIEYAGAITGRVTHVGWTEVMAGSKLLAEAINHRHSGLILKGLLVVTRGGLVPAGIISQHITQRRIWTVNLSSYTDDNKQKSIKAFNSPLSFIGDGDGWVCIDDIVDSGKTMEYVKRNCPQMMTVSLYAKHKTMNYPDIAYKLVPNNVWIHFPWEPA